MKLFSISFFVSACFCSQLLAATFLLERIELVPRPQDAMLRVDVTTQAEQTREFIKGAKVHVRYGSRTRSLPGRDFATVKDIKTYVQKEKCDLRYETERAVYVGEYKIKDLEPGTPQLISHIVAHYFDVQKGAERSTTVSCD